MKRCVEKLGVGRRCNARVEKPNEAHFLTLVSATPKPRTFPFLVWVYPIVLIHLAAHGYAGSVSSTVQQEQGYHVSGTVTAYAFDRKGDGSIRSNCEFVWYRQNEKWRLSIREPDSGFPGGVWHSILPFAEGQLLSIRSYPPRKDVTNSVGNAFVRVLTNRFVRAENIHGAHAVWLTLNLDHVLSLTDPEGGCPPFWAFDPAINNLQFKSHLVSRSNDVVQFFNKGRYYARDEKRRVVIQSGQPKMIPYPDSRSLGYIEAELVSSPDKWNAPGSIPRRSELTYFMPLGDEAQGEKLQFVKAYQLVVQCEKFEITSIPDAMFSSDWSNEFAVVVDERVENIEGGPLTFSTRSNRVDQSIEELQRRKSFVDTMMTEAARKSEGTHRLIVLTTICVVTALFLLGFWRTLRQKNIHP